MQLLVEKVTLSDAVRREIKELSLDDSVHLLGYRSDVPTLLASADVFLFSSLAEGLGTAVIEALSLDLAVVAFDIPSIREVTDQGRYARLVPIGDTERMAAAAISILGSKANRPVSSGWIAEQFAIDRVAIMVQEALEGVVAKHKILHERT